MKWLLTVCLALLLAACQLPNGAPLDVGAVVRETVKAVDRNDDGVVTNREIQDSKSDPNFWIAIGSALLGVLGLGTAGAARATAKKVEAETDQQWDNELKRLRARSEAKILTPNAQ